jgi:hypothetical protein
MLDEKTRENKPTRLFLEIAHFCKVKPVGLGDPLAYALIVFNIDISHKVSSTILHSWASLIKI